MTPNGLSETELPRRKWKKRLGMLLGGLSVIAACVAIRYYWGAGSANADTPWGTPSGRGRPLAADSAQPASYTAPAAAPASGNRFTRPVAPASTPAATAQPGTTVPEIVASVNGRPVTREELGRECLSRYGKEVLESMVNKQFILNACRERGLAVSRAEVDAEIEQMARRFGLPVEQWMKLLKQERGIRPDQYANDIIWPTLALRKLAGPKLAVNQQELFEAFEMEYGESVRARLIACTDQQKAEKVRAMAAANPADFPNLAKAQSEDAPSASMKGLIQPIHRHAAYKEIEDVVFAMNDGDVSPVIKAGGQFVILKREMLIPARGVKLEQVAPQLELVIRERKMRKVAGELFEQLKKGAVVENVINDPVRSRQMPGVAALINGSQITVRQLQDECVVRHGEEVLEGTIHRKLIEMACLRQNIAVSEQELDAEITRAAELMLRPLPGGAPDVPGWLKLVTERQGTTVEAYRRDVVWPSVALKKLVGSKIEITEDDMRKGFEANYGPRVRCRAIVLDKLRHAQQVWERARKNPTLENFGKLAAENSIEGASRAMQGEVPPIGRHGGQPLLEEEAFKLKPGELSGVIQLEDKYVILFCEGYTTPTKVQYAEVRDLIYQDIREKKQRMAMADYFDKLQETAAIDNFLAGKSKSPVKPGQGSKDLAPPRTLSVRPGAPRG